MTREAETPDSSHDESGGGFPRDYEQMLLDLYGPNHYGRHVADVRISIDDYEEGVSPSDPAA